MLTIQQIITTMRRKGYLVYTTPYRLNIVGVRNNTPINQNSFDDQLAYFYYDEGGKLYGNIVPGTTDPSTYFLKAPINDKGTAILKSGQYVDAYGIGLHRGLYEALVQVRPVTVFRDSDRDGYTNFGNVTETGLFGINIHRATINKQNKAEIGKDSAGCQVFMSGADYANFMQLARRSRELYGNAFTYTLIDERDAFRYRNTALVIAGLSLAGIALSYIAYKKLFT